MDVGCIVLAGGKALRLGHDKVTLTIGGQSLLQRVVSQLDSICKEVIVVTATARELPIASTKQAVDVFPGRGPLGGIYTGLKASGHFHNLVVASDMPFLNVGLLRYMISVSEGFDAIVPKLGEFLEPLHAVYSKRCMAPIEDMIKRDQLSVHRLLRMVKVRYVEAEEIERFDPAHLSFFNINTKADMDRARQLAGSAASD